jgi:hypothetical protein
MIIRIIKQLSSSDTIRLKAANKQTGAIAAAITPYCTSLYTLISKKMQAYAGTSSIWFHPLLREDISPYDQSAYQLKDLPARDYSFKSAWEPNSESLKGEREITLNDLFLELNFVQVSEEEGNGTDISLTILNEKHMTDTFVEHQAQLSFELFDNATKATLFSLANFFYDKPLLYKKTYEALVKNEKALPLSSRLLWSKVIFPFLLWNQRRIKGKLLKSPKILWRKKCYFCEVVPMIWYAWVMNPSQLS